MKKKNELEKVKKPTEGVCEMDEDTLENVSGGRVECTRFWCGGKLFDEKYSVFDDDTGEKLASGLSKSEAEILDVSHHVKKIFGV